MKEEKDDKLWQQAKAKADFKAHLTTYVIIIGIFMVNLVIYTRYSFISLANMANIWLGHWFTV